MRPDIVYRKALKVLMGIMILAFIPAGLHAQKKGSSSGGGSSKPAPAPAQHPAQKPATPGAKPGAPGAKPAHRCKKIDGKLVRALIELPVAVTGECEIEDYQSLAVRDLQRGQGVGLPSGEAVEARLARS